MNETKLLVSGLNENVGKKDLKEKFDIFGNVKKVKLRQGDDETSAEVAIDISPKCLAKCLSTLQNTKWKGKKIGIRVKSEDSKGDDENVVNDVKNGSAKKRKTRANGEEEMEEDKSEKKRKKKEIRGNYSEDGEDAEGDLLSRLENYSDVWKDSEPRSKKMLTIHEREVKEKSKKVKFLLNNEDEEDVKEPVRCKLFNDDNVNEDEGKKLQDSSRKPRKRNANDEWQTNVEKDERFTLNERFKKKHNGDAIDNDEKLQNATDSENFVERNSQQDNFMEMVRYNPKMKEHEIYEVKRSTPPSAKESIKQKKEGSQLNSTKTFYELDESFVMNLQRSKKTDEPSGFFSLLKTLGRKEDDKEEITKNKNKLFHSKHGTENEFCKFKKSFSEEESKTKKMNEKNERFEKAPQKTKAECGTFFFTENDPRLKEGIQFFFRPDLDIRRTWMEKRQEIHKEFIFHKKKEMKKLHPTLRLGSLAKKFNKVNVRKRLQKKNS